MALNRTWLIITIFFVPSIIWFFLLAIFGTSEDKVPKWITLIYPLMILAEAIIPFSDSLNGHFAEKYLLPLIRSLIIFIILIYFYRKDLSELSIDKEKQIWIFFGLFLIPFCYFVLVKFFGQYFNERIKASLAFVWMPFVFGIPSYVVEELYYRGYGINIMLKNGFGKWVAIIPSTIIFSLLHISQPDLIFWQLLPRIIVSLILSMVLLKTKKIVVPIIVHFLINLFLSILSSIAI